MTPCSHHFQAPSLRAVLQTEVLWRGGTDSPHGLGGWPRGRRRSPRQPAPYSPHTAAKAVIVTFNLNAGLALGAIGAVAGVGLTVAARFSSVSRD